MKHMHGDWLSDRKSMVHYGVVVLFLWTLTLLAAPVSGWTAGWDGCIGWNCDGKNPCTGMGCPDQSGGSSSGNNVQPLGTNPSGSESSGLGGSSTSGATKRPTSGVRSPKGASQKTGSGVPDLGGLTGKSQPEGWGGSRNTDTRTDQQRASQEAVKDLPDVQGLTGGGQSQPQGWGGELESDTRTIEQKLH